MSTNYDELIEKNMGLATNVVKLFKPRSKLEFDEYLEQARVGLLRAIKKHEREPGIGKLSTLAYRSIKWEILALIKQRKRYSSRHQRLIDVPYERELGNKIEESLPSSLTDQERKIIMMLASGYKKTEIYRTLGIGQSKFNGIMKTVIGKIKRANNEENFVLQRSPLS